MKTKKQVLRRAGLPAMVLAGLGLAAALSPRATAARAECCACA